MPAVQMVFQHVGAGQAGAVGVVVHDGLHLVPGNVLRGVGAQLLHQLLHRVHAALALKGKAAQRIAVVTELPVQRLDGVQQRLALLGVPGRGLADQQRRVDSVLVADVAAGQVAVALLKAEDKALHLACGLQPGDLVADPFEARKHISAFHPVMRGHNVRQRRGDDGFNAHRGFGHGAVLGAALADIIQQQHAHLVAGKQLIAAVLTAHGNAHAVGVRVGGKHQIRAGFFRQRKAQGQRLTNLGVGIRASGEITVRILLLGHNGDIRNADIPQHAGDRHEARTVQRRIHQLQPRGFAQTRANALGLDVLIQRLDGVLADVLDAALLQRRVEIRQSDARKNIGGLHLGIDRVGGFAGHLAAVRPVGLIAVVFGRVVAGRHHDAGVAVQMARGKAERRNGHQLLVKIRLDAVACQHARGLPRKHVAFDAAVVGDGDAFFAALLVQIICQTLRGLAHHIDVHAVRARTQHAAQARGAELQLHRETVLYLCVNALNAEQLGLQVLILQFGGKPPFIFLLIHQYAPAFRESCASPFQSQAAEAPRGVPPFILLIISHGPGPVNSHLYKNDAQVILKTHPYGRTGAKCGGKRRKAAEGCLQGSTA